MKIAKIVGCVLAGLMLMVAAANAQSDVRIGKKSYLSTCSSVNIGSAYFITNAAADNECVSTGAPGLFKAACQCGWDGASYTWSAIGAIAVEPTVSASQTKCMTIESPAAGDDLLFFRAESALTLTGIDCLVADGTSVALLVKECSSSGGTCGNSESSITCGTTNTTESAGIDDAAIDAGDWLRVDPGTNTGSVTQLSVCVTYTVND